VDQAVSSVIECPGSFSIVAYFTNAHRVTLESSGAMDRRQQILSFTLTPDQVTKLKAPKYAAQHAFHSP